MPDEIARDLPILATLRMLPVEQRISQLERMAQRNDELLATTLNTIDTIKAEREEWLELLRAFAECEAWQLGEPPYGTVLVHEKFHVIWLRNRARELVGAADGNGV